MRRFLKNRLPDPAAIADNPWLRPFRNSLLHPRLWHLNRHSAAGAVAGWPVAFLGFFLAAPLTLLAMIVIHVRRQSRALPYGPWLALGFFVASVFQDRILHYLGFR